MNHPHHDDRFDRAMQGLHRESLAHLSPETLRRLRDARSAATHAPARRFGWPFASAVAALLVLAVALPLRSPPPADTHVAAATQPALQRERAATAPPATPAARDLDDDAPATLVALEESPDFYLWLASEAGPDAVE